MKVEMLRHPTRKKIYRYVEIDKGIAPMIKELWAAKVRTYECCQGHEGIEKRTGHRFFLSPFLIIHKDDFDKAKPILKKYVGRFKTEKGTGGYCPREYNPCAPGDHNLYLFIYWRMK